MRVSQFLLVTQKENPTDAETISHRLMLKAGMIRQLGSGLYHWLPLGLRTLRKIERIVREEMNAIGCQELLMPAVQSDEIWLESGRWDSFGPELLKIKDRHGRNACIAPTHEEAITSMMRHELNSYKQLPMSFYQLQTKFRDEPRPRAGIMRSREFIMKDAYSFHEHQASLEQTYQDFYGAYVKIFTRLGLNFRAALADTGSIGGSHSHEFHVIADSGEDKLAISDHSDYCANVELAESIAQDTRPAATKSIEKVHTPEKRTIQAVCDFLNLPKKQSVKTLIVKGREHPFVALILRGDHELNELKAQKHPLIHSPLILANPDDIETALGCPHGYLGPISMTMPVIADRAAAVLADFCCGANQVDTHYTHANWGRDCPEPLVFDLRLAQEGDASPDGHGTLKIVRGIEVGHIFQLGDTYSKKMSATVLNEAGKSVHMHMGCYGVGVSRLVAASIEQHHDEKGMIWPDTTAPFQIVLIPINLHKSERVRYASESLYQQLTSLGYEVLFDDRNERPGVMFADAELIGIPHRLVLGEKGIDSGMIEYRHRSRSESQTLELAQLFAFLKETVCHTF